MTQRKSRRASASNVVTMDPMISVGRYPEVLATLNGSMCGCSEKSQDLTLFCILRGDEKSHAYC